MSGEVWQWQAVDRDGIPRIADSLTDPWADTPDRAADLVMARLLVRVAPDYGRLRGWQVRVCGVVGEGVAFADDWLMRSSA